MTTSADGWRKWLPAVVGGTIACLTYLVLTEILASATDTSGEETVWFFVACLTYWLMSLPVGLIFDGHGAWTFAAVLVFWCVAGGYIGLTIRHYSTLRGHRDLK